MGTRTAGDVYVVNSASTAIPVEVRPRAVALASANATTSGGVVTISVNTTGCVSFTLTNFGSIAVYVTGTFDNEFFISSVAMQRPDTATSASLVAVASAAHSFSGPYQIVRVVANSGSGVYRANLTYR